MAKSKLASLLSSTTSSKRVSVNIPSTYVIFGLLTIVATVLITIIINNANNSPSRKIKVVTFADRHLIDYSAPYLQHSTKSVDGESQFSPNSKWKAQPSKCFDCEAQMAQSASENAYNATKEKLFHN
jgi:hypothetical protein